MADRGLTAALLGAGAGHLRRSLTTQLRFARDCWTTFAGPSSGPGAWDPPPERTADLWRNWLVQNALDLAATARNLAQDLQPLADAPPPARSHTVDGRTVLLPARVDDASQGMAVYAVEPGAARDRLAALGWPFEPVVTGTGAALLAVLFVDYRRSDLGSYAELGAAVLARPAGDPLAPPGMVILSLPVSGTFTRDAGQQIWGYPKLLAPALRVERAGAEARCRLAPAEAAGFRITLSRRGFSASRELPFATYSVKAGIPVRTVLHRSGRSERLRFGGKVELALGKTEGGACPCGIADADGSTGCLCAMLKGFGLPKPPIATGWTEVMTARIARPWPLPQRPGQSSPITSA